MVYFLWKEVIAMFMTVKQAAKKWGLSDRRVRSLCAEGKIPGAFQEGRGWKIPAEYSDAPEPGVRRVRATIPVGQSQCSGQ